MSLFFLLSCLGSFCPLLIFLDFHKRKNISIAIGYVLVFFLLRKFVLAGLILHYGLYVAGAVPFLMLVLCVVVRIRNKTANRK